MMTRKFLWAWLALGFVALINLWSFRIGELLAIAWRACR
jgi:hypothetical protein